MGPLFTNSPITGGLLNSAGMFGAGARALSGQEFTSVQIASIAARGLKEPHSLSHDEIRAVCGSALTQAHDKT